MNKKHRLKKKKKNSNTNHKVKRVHAVVPCSSQSSLVTSISGNWADWVRTVPPCQASVVGLSSEGEIFIYLFKIYLFNTDYLIYFKHNEFEGEFFLFIYLILII